MRGRGTIVVVLVATLALAPQIASAQRPGPRVAVQSPRVSPGTQEGQRRADAAPPEVEISCRTSGTDCYYNRVMGGVSGPRLEPTFRFLGRQLGVSEEQPVRFTLTLCEASQSDLAWTECRPIHQWKPVVNWGENPRRGEALMELTDPSLNSKYVLIWRRGTSADAEGGLRLSVPFRIISR